MTTDRVKRQFTVFKSASKVSKKKISSDEQPFFGFLRMEKINENFK
eukprot:CAMPEP_0176346806 /NCGR_PEP_ID=MMETSP0126-20121128/6524_1 /TAXON_ID=141414 ORGANISM="Strombidinopsis acuminatum, Strain SPMC142" /NCGR_SAMPLE_ID=MMETSP0126 /ASSEMBLY_ACC=CAM_ASM_000229 /LENGTH=45 /DNA_ID= /DNA_START= /DNA_END= /DNA_ORIENTATION=